MGHPASELNNYQTATVGLAGPQFVSHHNKFHMCVYMCALVCVCVILHMEFILSFLFLWRILANKIIQSEARKL